MNSTSIPFTASDQVGNSCGGGGSVVVENGGSCEFSVVQPVNGFVNAYCPQGEQSENFTVTLYNPQATTQTYEVSLENVSCHLDQSRISIPGKSQGSVIVTNCDCPTNNTITGSVNITNNACTTDVPIRLYKNALGGLLTADFLFRAGTRPPSSSPEDSPPSSSPPNYEQRYAHRPAYLTPRRHLPPMRQKIDTDGKCTTCNFKAYWHV